MPATNKITTDLTPVPSRAAPSTFSAYMDTFLSKLPAWAAQANALADEADANADTAAEQAGIATTQAGLATAKAELATTQAGLAAISASSALNAPGTSATSTTSLVIGLGSKSLTIQTGKAFSVGQSVVIADTANPAGNYMWGIISSHDSATGALTVNVTEMSGTGTKTDWTVSLSASPAAGSVSIFRSARSSNTILGAADSGKLIDITSGTFTQTFDAVATLGYGWYCYLRNSGTGDITLDPNGAELIDGLASYIMYPGEVRLIQCDGAALRSVVLQSFHKVFTATDTFIKPPGYPVFSIELWGGGASGQQGAASTLRTGGAGAGCVKTDVPASLIGATETVTIAAGGTSVSTTDTAGNSGGNSSFAGLTAYGGAVAVGGGAFTVTAITSSPVTGGTSSSGITSGFLGGGHANPSASTSATFYSIYGGAAGNSINGSNQVTGFSVSIFGGTGGTTNAAGTTPTSGVAPGGGGAASTNGTASGPGARGELRIWGVL